jgi:chemotaxis protein MotB
MPNAHPIIIKKKVSHGGHHGGAWKVAYADFVTLFIVLWLLSSSKPVQEAVGGYFRDPSGNSNKIGTDMSGLGESLSITKDDMPKLKDELQKRISQINNFDKIKDQIEMTVTSEGLRIELLETDTGTFFDVGKPGPNGNGEELLSLLAQELGKLPNRLSIEGHTDSKPFSGKKEYGNWELSTDRANSARRMMQHDGVRPDQVSQVRGYADQMLRKKDDSLDASNRRISVIVQYLEKNPKDASAVEGSPEEKVSEKKAEPKDAK